MRSEIEEIVLEFFSDFDTTADDDVKDEFWHTLSEKDKYNINAEHLKRTANPKYDYLLCWEPGRFDTDVFATDFNTFFDIDYDWWLFQKKSRWDSIEDYKRSIEKHPKHATQEKLQKYIDAFNTEFTNGYKIYLNGDWYRLIDKNGTFLYSQFISAKWFLFYEAESLLDELESQKIPFTFRDDFDLIESCDLNDPKKIYEADGREHELNNLKKKLREYYSKELIKYLDFIISKYSRVFSGCTFRRDIGYEEGESFNPFTDFIFFDELSLKRVSPKNFLDTFNECKVDYSEFQIMIDEVKYKVESDFNKIYDENRSRYI